MLISKAEAVAQLTTNLEEARAANERLNATYLVQQDDARSGRRAFYETLKEAVRTKQDLLTINIDRWPAAPHCRYANVDSEIEMLERQLRVVNTIADETFVVAKDSVIWRAIRWQLPYWAQEKTSC